MYDGESSSERRSTPQYTVRSHARHRTSGGVRRMIFFTLAAVWGFIAGVTGLLIALNATGESIEARAALIAGVFPAFLLALAGGLVVAAAYREAKMRSR